jgi:excisionase family DNA binding protein
MIDKDLYKLKEVAGIFGVGTASVRNWIDRGKLKALFTPGGHRRVPKSELDIFLKKYPVSENSIEKMA